MRINCTELLIAEYGPLLKDCRAGHRWVFRGGCACPSDICRGHAVYECEVCGDCDYGDNTASREACEQYAETALCYL